MSSSGPSPDQPRPHYHDLLGVSPLVYGLRTFAIAAVALVVALLTRLPPSLIALSAIALWAGWNAYKDVKDWLTR
jgi:hypothetical protein